MLAITQMEKKSIPENVKFSGKQKFPSRIMVWCAISPKGLVLRVLGLNTMNNVRYKNVYKKTLSHFSAKIMKIYLNLFFGQI